MILEGKTIKGMRYLTDDELANEGWDQGSQVSAIMLNDGLLIYPSRDYEGNGPGALFSQQDNKTFTITTQ